MSLVPGMLLSFDNPIINVVPNLIVFQYNPNTVTRIITPPLSAASSRPQKAGRAQADFATETYSLKLEFDATDGLERRGALTMRLGIAPRLAALELLMQPPQQAPLSTLVRKVGRRGAKVPANRVPLVIMAWGPARVAPVKLESLTITETAFDELLNPIHASADVGMRVVRPDDTDQHDVFARAAASYYQGAREVMAVLSIPQLAELTSPGHVPSARGAGS